MVKINVSLSKEKRILKAAEQVFSHKGYTQATLDEIIQIADTGKGTVYKYYKNKENLFYTLVEAKNRKLMKAMETAVEEGETFSDQFRGYVEAFLHFLEKNETLWSVILFELLNQQPAGGFSGMKRNRTGGWMSGGAKSRKKRMWP